MTIASCLTRLSAARDAIISAINGKGGSATGHGFEDFATDIAALASSSWKKIATQDYTVSTTSTSAATTGTMQLGVSAYTSGKIIYVKIRDKAGAREGYFVGSDTFFINPYPKNGTTSTLTSAGRIITRKASGGAYNVYVGGTTTGYGVYAYSINNVGALVIQQRYNSSNSLTINGTYEVTVWTLDYVPDQGNPFDYTYPATT